MDSAALWADLCVGVPQDGQKCYVQPGCDWDAPCMGAPYQPTVASWRTMNHLGEQMRAVLRSRIMTTCELYGDTVDIQLNRPTPLKHYPQRHRGSVNPSSVNKVRKILATAART